MSACLVNCTVCQSNDLATVIDFGEQPPANRFIDPKQSSGDQDVYPLAFGYCKCCGTAQLTKRMPVEATRPRYDWLLYNEPEGHLDGVAEELAVLPGINKDSTILGVTYKDQSTIDRLKKLGLPNGECIAIADFQSPYSVFGLETMQQILRQPNIVTQLNAKYGKSDILLMRHVIEHTDNAAELILALKPLINDNGYLVLELPDSEKLINSGNHAFIWEEHISYFTEKSLTSLANRVGAVMSWYKRCSYPYEDSLLVAFQFTQQLATDISVKIVDTDDMLAKFSDSFDKSRKFWLNKLKECAKNDEKVAVFGAGHLAAKFINFFDLSEYIDCVIDDNKHKAGMHMPGSALPIVSSSEMTPRKIKVCISTLSPESEAKVRDKLSIYFANDIQLIPAFVPSGTL